MPECTLCRSSNIEAFLDLGRQPVASHFTRGRHTPIIEYELALAICGDCGLVQLFQPFPYAALVPPYRWVTQREPEGHLDRMVEQVMALPGLDREALVVGATYKDRSTLERFAQRGCRTHCIDLHADLGAADPNANIETAQHLLTPEAAEVFVGHHGQADVLIVRHLAEHAEACWRLLGAARRLLHDDGYLVIEVPDCGPNLDRQDYTMIWEEHTAYFTPETFRVVLPIAGFGPVRADIYRYSFENCMVQIGRKIKAEHGPSVPRSVVAGNRERLMRFSGNFTAWTAAYRKFLYSHTEHGKQVALYGAGHLASAFVTFHGVGDFIAFVVDDTPHKQELFMPKCGLRIVPRDRLVTDAVSICLLGLSPDHEGEVIDNNKDFLSAGGQFYSIFADSRRSLRNVIKISQPS